MPRTWRSQIADETRATSMMKPKPTAKVEIPRWAALMVVRNFDADTPVDQNDLERALGVLRDVLTPDEIATGRLNHEPQTPALASEDIPEEGGKEELGDETSPAPQMHRFRFMVPGGDYRPMEFPPVGPFWCSGTTDTHCIVVAYAPDLETLTSASHWPDAEGIDDLGEQPITFTARFRRPDWWEGDGHTIGETA